VQTNISTRHGHLSAKTQQKVVAKIEKLPRLFDRITAADVTIDLAHPDNPEVEVRLSVEHADDLVATKRADEFWASLDGALHKLEQQLRKHKDKLTDRRAAARKRQQVPVEPEIE